MKVIEFEIGLLFENEQGKDGIESLFQKLNTLHEFDGIKKISHTKESNAVLLSSDESLEISLTEQDITLSYTNTKLKRFDPENYVQLSQLISKIQSYAKKNTPIQAVRFSEVLHSASESDRLFFPKQVFNIKYAKSARNYDVLLDLSDEGFSEENEEDLDLYVSVNISTEHTTKVHNLFQEQDKAKLLEKSIFIQSNIGMGIGDHPTNQQITNFIKTKVNEKLSQFTLEKLGYGQK